MEPIEITINISKYSAELAKRFDSLVLSALSKKGREKLEPFVISSILGIHKISDDEKLEIKKILDEENVLLQSEYHPHHSEYWICNGNGKKHIGIRSQYPSIEYISA